MQSENPHETQSAIVEVSDSEREPFNDAIGYFDSVSGMQTVKQIDQVPKRWRIWVRWGAIIAVLGFLVIMIISIIDWF